MVLIIVIICLSSLHIYDLNRIGSDDYATKGSTHSVRSTTSSHSRLLVDFHVHLAATLGHGAGVIGRRRMVVLTIGTRLIRIRSGRPGGMLVLMMPVGSVMLAILIAGVVIRARRMVGTGAAVINFTT